MGIAFRVLWQAIRDFYDEMFVMVGANLLWVVMAIPVVTIPLGNAGMMYLTNQIAHHKSIEFRMFFQGIKEYWAKSYLLALLNVLAAVLFYANMRFYGQMNASWASVIQGLFVGLFVIWCLIQIYVFPMLMEQQEPRLLLALRNAAFLAFASPIPTIVLAVLLIVVAALCIGLAFLFAVAMMAVICLAANGAVLKLLIHHGIRKPPEEVPADS